MTLRTKLNFFVFIVAILVFTGFRFDIISLTAKADSKEPIKQVKEITIYTKSTCGYCHKAKEALSTLGLKYKEVEISDNLKLYKSLKAKTGCETVPQIFFGTKFIGGYTDLKNLIDKGSLGPMLESE